MAMCVYYANDMHIIFKLGPCKSCSSGFSEVPIKHGLVITSSIQLSEVVYRLTKLWLVSLIFFRPLNPLEMVVPTCDDYKVGPHQTWKPVCVCVCVCVCVSVCGEHKYTHTRTHTLPPHT